MADLTRAELVTWLRDLIAIDERGSRSQLMLSACARQIEEDGATIETLRANRVMTDVQ